MNEFKYFFIIILSIISHINSADNKYLIFDFRTNIDLNEVNNENYMKIKYDQKLYVDMEIGKPPQKIPMTIKTFQYPTFLASTKIGDYIKIKYKQDSSTTFSYVSQSLLEGMFQYDFNKGYISKDILNIKTPIKDFYFMLGTSVGVGVKNTSGVIGLSKTNPDKNVPNIKQVQFIKQLLDNNLISQKIFGIIFETEYEGKLIFGKYLHELDNSYKENECIMDTDVSDNKNNMWMMKFDVNCISGIDKTIIYTEESYGFMYFELGLIVGSTVFERDFVKDYFSKRNCQSEHVDASYHFNEYYCTDKSQFEDFPNITLRYKDQYNFVFTRDDLFIKRGEKYIFQIVFDIYATEGVQYWKIGQFFFKKYSVFFKEEEKGFKMAYYLKPKFDSKKIGYGTNTQVVVIVVLSIILGLLIIGIIIYFRYFYPKTRKKKIYEIPDMEDVEYIPQGESKNKLMDNDKDE